MIKISVVFLGTIGSGPVYSLEMAKALFLSKRCKLQIIISNAVSNLNAWETAFSENKDVDFHKVKTYDRNLKSALLSFFKIKRMNKVVRIIKNYSPDVLYAPFHIVWAPYIYRMIQGKIRIISTLHDPHPHDGGGNIIGRLSDIIFFNTLLLSDDIIILNYRDRLYVNEKFGKMPLVIPHASSAIPIHYDAIINKKQKLEYTIGFIGRIEPYKGLDILLDAFYKITEIKIRLIIAGAGKISDDLMKKIKGSQSIKLLNRYIEEEEYPGIMESIDMVVLPYKEATQSGVIPLSFAYGKPVIATKVGALEEQVPEDSGILTNVDANEIAQKIEELYSEPEMIFKMSQNAYKYANDVLTWNHSATTLLDFLEEKRLLNDN